MTRPFFTYLPLWASARCADGTRFLPGRLARRLAAVVGVGLLISAAAVPAHAAGSACYTQEEFEAEQAIRLHTEMMMVGLTCRNVVPGKDLFQNYGAFTSKHRTSIQQAEKVLQAHFRKRGGGAHQFDTFRTELANHSSRRAATLTSQHYCDYLAPNALAAPDVPPEQIRKLVSDDAVLRLSSRPLCKAAAATPTGADGQMLASATPIGFRGDDAPPASASGKSSGKKSGNGKSAKKRV